MVLTVRLVGLAAAAKSYSGPSTPRLKDICCHEVSPTQPFPLRIHQSCYKSALSCECVRLPPTLMLLHADCALSLEAALYEVPAKPQTLLRT